MKNIKYLVNFFQNKKTNLKKHENLRFLRIFFNIKSTIMSKLYGVNGLTMFKKLPTYVRIRIQKTEMVFGQK